MRLRLIIHRVVLRSTADTMTHALRKTFDLTRLELDPTWSFADCTQAQTRYISHGYHTYPAKFIPQLAARLIQEYSSEGEIVVDPFMGSGTTIVEAMVSGRIAVGVDINPVAHLIAKVKATPLEPALLASTFAQLERDLTTRSLRCAPVIPANARIDYWFPPKQKRKLGQLLGRLAAVDPPDVRDFFLVAFSQILKPCSIWLQRSIKPTRDFDKVPVEPLDAFLRQSRRMTKRNREFWEMLPAAVRRRPAKYRRVECADARALPLADRAASLIVTSPPYVTSYEYADLHQLAALWFRYGESLPAFRKRFIGTAHSERLAISLESPTAERICQRLQGRKADEVRNYFGDMLECFREMRRVLQVGGKACIVIGNTRLTNVEILNGEVFVEQMGSLGLRVHKTIKREIPSKILPQTRDPRSGRFASAGNASRALAYPYEYILIMEKK
jgi:DNA modification methylase